MYHLLDSRELHTNMSLLEKRKLGTLRGSVTLVAPGQGNIMDQLRVELLYRSFS